MHRFKKIFSTIEIFIIYIFRMISSFFSFYGHAPFMAENRKGPGRPARAQSRTGIAAAIPDNAKGDAFPGIALCG